MILTSLLLAAALQEKPVPPGKGSAEAAPAGYEVPWVSTWDEALAAAKKIPNGRILIEFVDNNCGGCQRMEALIVPSTSFFSFMRDKVALRLVRSSADGQRLSAKFGVATVPAWVVTTPDLLLSGFQMGQTSQTSWFQTFSQTERSWGDYRRKLDEEAKNPANQELVFDVARETFKRGGDPLAETRFQRLVDVSTTKPEIKEQSLAYLASIKLDSKRVEEAAKDLELLIKIGKDPVLHERAQLRMADVELARGRKDQAIRRLEEFQKTYPSSPRFAEAGELLKVIRPEAP